MPYTQNTEHLRVFKNYQEILIFNNLTYVLYGPRWKGGLQSTDLQERNLSLLFEKNNCLTLLFGILKNTNDAVRLLVYVQYTKEYLWIKNLQRPPSSLLNLSFALESRKL